MVTRDGSSSALARYPEWVAPAVGVALVLGLGFHRLGDESFWIDEGLSAWATRQTWADLLAYIVDERPVHSLYYPVLKVWSVLGSSEVVLRSLSVVCMAAAAGILAVLARRLFGRTAGVAAGVLFAVNPFVIAYAQEARVYAIVVLLAVSASLLLVRALDRPSPGRWAGWALCASLLVYAHAAAGTVLAAHAVAILGHPQRPTRPALVAGGFVAVALAPLAVLVARTGTSTVEWIEPSPPGAIYLVIIQLAGRSELALAVLAALAGLGVVSALKRSRANAPSWEVGFATLLFVCPLLIILLVSQVVPMLVPRYVIVALVGAVLLAASGVAALRRPWLAVLAVLIFVAVSVPGLRTSYTFAGKADWRGAAALVASSAQPGDVVVIAGFGRRTFRYYHDRHPVKATRWALTGGLRRTDRVWVVFPNREPRDPQAERLRRELSEQRRAAGRWRFTGLSVVLFSSG